jgi:tetratricopeptide (TPR) repeat protein
MSRRRAAKRSDGVSTKAPARSPFVGGGLLLVVAAVFATHAGSLGGDLVLDARPLILENPAVRQATLANLRTLLSSPYWHPLANDGLYRPFTTVSYLVNYAVLGGAAHPFGYHLVNLLLHLGCVALVYALVRVTIERTVPAVLAAAVFGVHPMTTEVVANVVGRADILATLGVVGGLLCHIRAVRAAHGRRALWRTGLVVAGLVAAFSKETGLVLIGVLLLYDFVADRSSRAAVPGYVMVGLVAVFYLATRWVVAQYAPLADDPSPLDNPIVEASFVAGRATAVKALGYELSLLVWPATLNADYSFAQIPVVRLPPESWDDWQAAIAVVAIACLVIGVLRTRHRIPTLAFFFLFLFVTLLPTANLVVVIGAIMAERFLYLPLVGFAGMVAILGDHALQDAPPLRRRVVVGVFVVVLAACAIRTFARNRDWRSDAILAARTVETAPRSAKAHSGYGAVLFDADPKLERVEEAIAEEERAIAIRPDYLQALINLGRYEVAAGEAASRRGRDAERWYTKAIATLGRASTIDEALDRRFAERMIASGRGGDGIPEIGHLELYEALAMASARLGRLDEAVTALEHARRLSPVDLHWYLELAATLQQLGRWEEAAITLFQAMAIRSDSPEPVARLAMLYRTFDPEGHEAFVPEPGRLSIDLDHATVRRHRCEAYRRLGAIFNRANLRRAAANAAEVAARVCVDR